MRERFLSAVYPRRCPICDGILSAEEPYICRSCAGRVRFIHGPVCMQCGAPLEGQEWDDPHLPGNSGEDSRELCRKCAAADHVFRQGYAPFLYRGDIRRSLMRLKYGNRAEYARFFGKALAVYGKPWLEQWDIQRIIPVPVHPSRERKRGYNQAAEIARELGKQVHIPVDEESVCRVRHTTPQKELTRQMRRRNLEGAFQIRPGARLPDRVLVVDDIFTTGATVDELARTLMESGVREVCAACASID